MEFIRPDADFKFMRLRYLCMGVSLAVIACSLYLWFTRGDGRFGVDFLGGTEIVASFEKPVNITKVRTALSRGGFSGAVVQEFEHDNSVSIRLKSKSGAGVGEKIKALLSGIEGNSFTIQKEDYVGPIIGEQIKKDGLWALAMSLIGILVYVSIRFEWRFALGAVVALVHDVVITTGVFLYSGREISVAVLAALLTIVGYSLNDTIIVFDRIRENLSDELKGKASERGKKASRTRGSKAISLTQVIDKSINQTLSRTLLTSFTTLFVVACLFFLGGGAVVDLSFTLLVGVIVGTYSSIFIASPVLLFWTSAKSE